MKSMSYKKFNNLQGFLDFAKQNIDKNKERNLNFIFSAEITARSLRKDGIASVTEKAEQWRNKIKPDDLVINHGSYMQDGLDHIIEELIRKPSSNRALYSLINQKDISGSGDNAIPSFMIFQCAIDPSTNILYCTSYFRALEVCNFLPINLEEMRLNICNILERQNIITKIRFCIFAFCAYYKPNQLPLERCELDKHDSLYIDDLYKKGKWLEIVRLLEEKAQETTVIEVKGLETMKAWLRPDRNELLPKGLIIDVIRNDIDAAISAAERLRSLRHSDSHSPFLSEVSKDFTDKVNAIANRIRSSNKSC